MHFYGIKIPPAEIGEGNLENGCGFGPQLLQFLDVLPWNRPMLPLKLQDTGAYQVVHLAVDGTPLIAGNIAQLPVGLHIHAQANILDFFPTHLHTPIL